MKTYTAYPIPGILLLIGAVSLVILAWVLTLQIPVLLASVGWNFWM
jgi:hypothetical protein